MKSDYTTKYILYKIVQYFIENLKMEIKVLKIIYTEREKRKRRYYKIKSKNIKN